MGQVTKDMGKTKVLNIFLAFVFTGRICLQDSMILEASGKVYTEEDFFSVEEDQVWEHLNRLVIWKSIGPSGIMHQ